MKTNMILLSDKEAEELRALLEEAEGIPVNYERHEPTVKTGGLVRMLRHKFKLMDLTDCRWI